MHESTRASMLNWSRVGALSFAALLTLAGCPGSGGGGTPSSTTATSSNTGPCEPEPPPKLAAGATDDTADTWVKVKASTYGGSGGGLYVMVDVADPDQPDPPYTDVGLPEMWVGTGDNSTTAPSTAPTTDPHLSSLSLFDLNSRSWGGGVVVDRPGGHTRLWVFVQVELERNDGGTATKRWFSGVLHIENTDLPTGWVTLTAL